MYIVSVFYNLRNKLINFIVVIFKRNISTDRSLHRKLNRSKSIINYYSKVYFDCIYLSIHFLGECGYFRVA